MEPKIYLITGVMASGKSTTAELLARKFPRAVHLRGDIFRKMIVSGREEMAENPSDEAVRQLHLRYELAAGAARRYWEAGFTVVLQDNYYGEEWPRMLERFKGLPLRAVVLCPPVRVVEARERARAKTGYTGFAVGSLWQGFMESTPRAGFWLDNGALTPEETAEAILRHFEEKEGR